MWLSGNDLNCLSHDLTRGGLVRLTKSWLIRPFEYQELEKEILLMSLAQAKRVNQAHAVCMVLHLRISCQVLVSMIRYGPAS